LPKWRKDARVLIDENGVEKVNYMAKWFLLPKTATPDAIRLIAARATRAFADGLVSVLLPAYLSALDYSTVQIGAIVTATLLGSAAFTLGVGLLAHRWSARVLLLAACTLMVGTGLGFAEVREFLPLIVLAFVGTLNPTAGDVSVFITIEQSLLASQVEPEDRAGLYARSNVAAAGSAALGALASAFPEPLARASGLALVDAMRFAFLVYASAAIGAAFLYAGLRAAGLPASGTPRVPLARSRGIVLRLAALFTLDSFGGGFVVQSILALWLFQRFSFSLADAAGFFFGATLLSGVSQLLSPLLARRIGLVQTMVFTHIPANLLLVTAAFMPTAPLAVAFLLLRMTFSSMDVSARQAFVMSAVPPEERTAAASVTNVPRSLGSGLSPLFSGGLLAASSFGWPLVIGGTLKIVYDLLLLRSYRHHEASRLG
jgi:MFS family permease